MNWKKQFLIVYMCGLGALLGMIFLPERTLPFTVLGALLTLITLFVNPSRERLLFAVVMFILGASAEITATYFGAWSYPMPNIFGIPCWIPFMWVIVGFAILEIQTLIRHLVRHS